MRYDQNQESQSGLASALKNNEISDESMIRTFEFSRVSDLGKQRREVAQRGYKSGPDRRINVDQLMQPKILEAKFC